MKKICILADSLAAPREDNIADAARWPQVLFSQIQPVEYINRVKGASTTKKVKKLVGVEADIFIIQLGIVDCAPRLFTRFESKQLARLPQSWREKIIKWAKENRQPSTERAYVKPNKFEKNLKRILQRANGSSIIFIKIINPGEEMLKSNPSIQQQIDLYNSIIERMVSIDNNVSIITIPDESIEEITLDDGYHLNEQGHQVVANLVIDQVNQILRSR
ncbi:SGNH/GDSL hydrolase family protein [Vibrio vulnificus]|nr:SGNH/GDSL hydrolase family protein [Vibrio vulnificus]